MGEGATTGETTDGSSHKSHRGKRKDASGDSATSSKKRRFVWPDGLHVKFVSAVFDVGLRCSSAQTIASAISRSGSVDVSCVETLLSRYRMTRGISGGSRLSASAGDAEAETALFQSIGRVKSEEDVENSDSTSEVFARSISIARRQVEISLQSDELLRKFQGRLRASLERQRILIAAIKSAKNNQQEPPRKGHGSSSVDDDSEESENEEPRSVVRLGPDPSRRVVVKASNSSPWKSGDKSSFLRPSGSRFPPRNDEVPSSSADAAGAMNMIAMSSGVGIGGRGGSENTSSRPRLPPTAALMANDGLRMTDARSIQQEMESQLSMHRQMLLRKTDQLTLFETEGEQAAASPVPAMEAAAPWNFEATDLDEELFDFLNE